MYNQDLKIRFIRQYTTSLSTARACELVFESTSKFEEEYGADFCTLFRHEIIPIVEAFAGVRYLGKNMRIAILREYVKWCKDIANVPGARSDMLDIAPDGTEKMRAQTVSSPEHLQWYLDCVFDRESEKTIDNLFRTYFWLAFAGMEDEEILSAKRGDVDFVKMVIHGAQVDFVIYREAVPAIKNCVELAQFWYKHTNYETWRDRAPGDMLMRNLGSKTSAEYLHVAISNRTKSKEQETGMRLSYYRTWISGIKPHSKSRRWLMFNHTIGYAKQMVHAY